MAKMEIKFTKDTLKKLEAELGKKFEDLVAKHPFKKGDSLQHIEETLVSLLKKVGGALGPAAVKEKAKEIFDKLNKH
ncbi:hypothetical protein ACFY5D_21465 [Paeniglutamicibacter sp. NPDC012692]|uniref:hypothetical protein n=1 Tax=Paeniglutamicibacter sp. NPDC012692 TaxID=3364388 RepID=UPI00369D6B3D